MGKQIDLVVSFDTTGSMYPVLSQVRNYVEKFVNDMFREFDDLRLGIIAHGDYCDKDDPYTIRIMDLTRDEKKLCQFIRETDKTCGGDADECYELVLNSAHSLVGEKTLIRFYYLLVMHHLMHQVIQLIQIDLTGWKRQISLESLVLRYFQFMHLHIIEGHQEDFIRQ